MAPAKDFAVLVATNQAGDTAFEATDLAAWRLIQRHLGITTAGDKLAVGSRTPLPR